MNDSAERIRAAKRRLRREVVDRVLGMEPGIRGEEERELDRLFPTLPGLEAARTVLLYVSHLPEEFETRGMIAWALGQGKDVACPRVDRQDRSLRLCRVTDPDRDLVPGPFGIPEPSAGAMELDPVRIDWVLVPGIAFDGQGGRLGRGAGHYDRLLPRLRPEVPRLALVLDPQWVDVIPTAMHDQPVDGVVGVHRRWLGSTRTGEQAECPR
ncbi:5-formyltetrahydrofolate cyclo-ligase [Tautonia sociabilis]|uniref:5-formyltetrahydrofolate cyclo-ligase n=1 Tax=Tautonia sociabilis TaxID=2080755 RepID=A0A432MPW0_9BACT|nr:5-formyltetrahydrofolate cyclo-ligase [Tautonia sociabilis]RUL89511.1 5-formyltetrahydrofolate cyclo-ligase [Tautonia sociabilis]